MKQFMAVTRLGCYNETGKVSVKVENSFLIFSPFHRCSMMLVKIRVKIKKVDF